MNKGTLHPLTITLAKAIEILQEKGFSVASGPELEDQWHNFDALNVPKDHPARDMQDTFFIKPARPHDEGAGGGNPGYVLRTHTSPVQIRYMKTHTPPFAIAVPGKVFRNEATDATHEMQFHQLEGLVVGEGVTVEHLKGTLLYFFRELFGEGTDVRLRPSFFPFVEPGFEVDVWVAKPASAQGSGEGRWLEVAGAGMVHPNVFASVEYPTGTTGFAFGMGLDRLANVLFEITDVRYAYQGDLRLNQWGS